MLLTIKFRLIRLLSDVATALISKKKYQRLVDQIIDMDEKNNGADLKGWTYRKIPSTDQSFHHRYYHLPSRQTGAPIMLFLHGLNFDGRNFLGMKELAKKFELVAYDFPETSHRYQNDFDDFSSLIDDFLEVYPARSVYLAGVSLGGMVAIRYAGSRPDDLVKALILISTRIPGTTEELRGLSHLVADMFGSYSDIQLYWIYQLLAKRHFRNLDPRERAETETILRPKNMDFYRRVFVSLRGYDGIEDTRNITCPTLVLLGTNDQLIPLVSADEFRKYHPKAEVRIIEDGEHDMSFRQPWLISEHIRGFLEKQGLIEQPT